MKSKILYTNKVGATVDGIIESLGSPAAVVIADSNTSRLVVPQLLEESRALADAQIITVEAGEKGKSLESLTRIWSELSEAEATRSTVVVNVGGGVVTDIGGFAAATYKRGLRFINVPTTLLGAVDASYGGKTGINFRGIKNLVGVFAEPEATIVSTRFFSTLAPAEILSGYAEMLKHGLLEGADVLGKLLAYSPADTETDCEELLPLIRRSIEVKQRIVAADPRESGLRKVLNLGHTAGHAIESLAQSHGTPIPHGYAVAQGLVTALVLSHMELGFPSDILHQVAAYVREHYGAAAFGCKDYPDLFAYMRNDKKNTTAGHISYTLLKSPGEPLTNIPLTESQITPALDITSDLLS